MISYLVLKAHDPLKVAAFYECLGLKFNIERHGNGPVHLACEIAGTVLEIYPRENQDMATHGLRIGIEVDDVVGVYKKIAEKQLSKSVSFPPSETQETKQAVVQDPEGHTVHIVQKPNMGDK